MTIQTYVGIKNSEGSKLNKYTLHYVIQFEVQIPLLPNMMYEEKIEEQRYSKIGTGTKNDCWVINLDNQHTIWKLKDEDNEAKNDMMKLLKSIRIKTNSQQIAPVNVSRR